MAEELEKALREEPEETMKEGEEQNMNYDITFCNRDCNNKKCQRNLKYVDKRKMFECKPFISMAEWKDCKDFKGEGKNV